MFFLKKPFLVLLSRHGNDTYEWTHPKPSHQARFSADLSYDYLNRAVKVCGFQNMTVPEGRRGSGKTSCPASVDPTTCVVPPAVMAANIKLDKYLAVLSLFCVFDFFPF